MAPTCATLSTQLLPGLDWRPLLFEHPLPPDRVCEVCGVVCRETVVLPCFHILCNVCFEHSVDLGCVCPLGREVFDQDDVDKLKLRPGQLLKLRVSCWNSALGCDFLGPVSELLNHFERDCVHHSVPCARCHQDVPRLGLVQHCVNGCDPTTSVRASPPDGTHQGGQLLDDLEKASAEIKQSIAELKDGYYGLQASVNTVADDVQVGRSEARRAMAEIASGMMVELQTTQPDVTHWGGLLREDFEKASTEIKQSVAQLRSGSHWLQTSVNAMAQDVKLGRSEARQAKIETISALLAKLHTTQEEVTHWGVQSHKNFEKASTESKLSITQLKDWYYKLQTSVNAVAHDVKLGRSDARQAKTEIVKNLLTELRAIQPDADCADVAQFSASDVKTVRAALFALCTKSTNKGLPSGCAETVINVGRRRRGRRCVSLPELSCVTTGVPRRVRWIDTATFKDTVSEIKSDRFLVDGKVAFFRLQWQNTASDSPVVFFRLHFPKGHPFQSPVNVRILAPQHPHIDICCQVFPDGLNDPRMLDLCTLATSLESPMQIVVDLEL